jgi:RNA polymerase sigma factor (sigma-70 family)
MDLLQTRPAESAAREDEFHSLRPALEPEVRLLLEQEPYRRYLDADSLWAALREAYLARRRRPENCRHWVLQLAQTHLFWLLVRRARDDDHEAGAELDRQIRQWLGPMLRAEVARHPQLRHERDELINTAFYRMLIKIREGNHGPCDNPVGYCRKIITNRIRELLRQGGRRSTSNLDEQRADRLEARGRPVLDELADRDLGDRCLAGMPADVREIYRLWNEGMSWEEVGSALALSADNARKKFSRWLARVREQLGSAGEQ